MLNQLLDAQLPPPLAQQHLSEHGVDVGAAVCATVRGASAERLRELQIALWRAGMVPLTAQRSGGVVVILPDRADAVAVLRQACGKAARVGVSKPIGRVQRLADAWREAVWAAQTATERQVPVVSYDQATPWLGARSPDDAQALVDHVLGAVLAQPVEQAEDLLNTLRVFLTHGRSWQAAAQVLHVHRQTVLYRIRKVEQLTGRRVSQTADLAALWLAVQANDLLRGTK